MGARVSPHRAVVPVFIAVFGFLEKFRHWLEGFPQYRDDIPYFGARFHPLFRSHPADMFIQSWPPCSAEDLLNDVGVFGMLVVVHFT